MNYQVSILTSTQNPFGKPEYKKMDIIKPIGTKEAAEKVADVLKPHIFKDDILCIYNIENNEVVYRHG